MSYAGVVTTSSAFTKLSTQTISSNQAAIDFTSIPGTYTNLIVEMMSITAGGSGVRDGIQVYLNGNLGASSYSWMMQELPTTSGGTGQWVNSTGDTWMRIGNANGASTAPSWMRLVVPLYTGGLLKMATAESAHYNAASNVQIRSMGTGYFNSTAVITAVGLRPVTGQWGVGTVATLWGQS